MPIFWIMPDGRFAYANEAAGRMLGYPPEEIRGALAADLHIDFPPEHRPDFWEDLREGGALDFSSILRSREGRIFPVELAVSYCLHEGVEYAVTSAKEISERRETERALRESQERLKVLFEYAPDAYYLSDLGGKFVDANRAAEELTGYARYDLIGRSFLDLKLVDSEQIPLVARALSFNALGRPMRPGELLLTRKDGGRIWAEVRTYPLRIQGEYLILGIARDVTARKTAERELRLTQFTMDQAVDPVFWVALDGAILNANEAASRSLGYKLSQLLGKKVWEIDPTFDTQRWALLMERLRDEGPETFTSEHLTADGTLTPVEIMVSHVEFEGEEFVVASTRNIRERLLVEKAVERSEAEFRAIFEESPYGILRTSVDGEVLMANPAMAEILGYGVPEELKKLQMGRDVWAEEGEREEEVARARETGRIDGEKVRWRRKDGEEITVRLSSRLVRSDHPGGDYFEDMVEDVSEQVRLEEQLRQAQKMEAVGQLTGGIAHDFNNLLSVILLNSELVRTALEAGNPIPLDDLAEVEEAARKAAAMTRQLLGFSRKAALTKVPTDLGEVVGNLSAFMRRLLPENIRHEVEIESPIPLVEADIRSVEQILINLATNARDAMADGGALTLRVRAIPVGEEDAGDRPWVIPGTYVEVSAQDTGSGMDQATLKKVFEPFFTTKGMGQGTGLGMAMVYGLTKQHGGFVHIDSGLGEGTRVELLFPVTQENRTAPSKKERTEKPQTGNETILLVEDEEALRRSGKRVLERFGYTVVLAADGEEGLREFRSNREGIDLVISDMVMPNLGGAELYRALRDEGEMVPFLMVSGYTGDESMDRKLLDPGVMILPKPWDISDLLKQVRGLLD
jgi:PAS domain S-box-containing protein